MSLEVQAQTEYDEAQDSTYDLASAIIDWVATPSGAQALVDAKITPDHLLNSVTPERVAREIMEWVYTYRSTHNEWPQAERVYEHFRQHYQDEEGQTLTAERPGRIPVSDLAERLHTRKLRNDSQAVIEQWALRGDEDAVASLNHCIGELTEIARREGYGTEEWVPTDMTGEDVLELYLTLGSQSLNRVTTGFELCDKKWNGGYRGLTVFAGRMGGCKSWMLSFSAVAAARLGHNVVVFTLELDHDEWMQRYMAHVTNTSWTRLDGGQLSLEEQKELVARYEHDVKDMAGSIRIVHPPEDQRTVQAMRTYAEQFDATVVYVDQFNFIHFPGKYSSDYEMLTHHVPTLKSWASSLDGALIIAHQRNRLAEEKKKSHNFGTDTLARSDDIARYADMVVTTSQLADQKRVGAFTLGTIKNRNGPYEHFDFAVNFTNACQIKCIGIYKEEE